MKTSHALVLPALILLVAAGCASGSNEAQNAMKQQESRLAGLVEQVDRNAAAARENKSEIAALSEQISALESRLATTAAEEQAVNQEIKENLSFMNDQLLRLDSSMKTKSPGAPPSAANVFKPGGFAVDSAYKGALDEYYAKRYESAISGFTEVLTVSPQSPLADNAQYWIGECYFAMRNYPKALEAFLKVFNFPKSNKHADAHLKIGLTHLRMENATAGREELQAVTQNYPGTAAAKIAAQELAKLGE